MLNLNVPRGATTRTELRRTVQSEQPYYVSRGPGPVRPLDQPYQFPVEVVVDWTAWSPGPITPSSTTRWPRSPP